MVQRTWPTPQSAANTCRSFLGRPTAARPTSILAYRRRTVVNGVARIAHPPWARGHGASGRRSLTPSSAPRVRLCTGRVRGPCVGRACDEIRDTLGGRHGIAPGSGQIDDSLRRVPRGVPLGRLCRWDGWVHRWSGPAGAGDGVVVARRSCSVWSCSLALGSSRAGAAGLGERVLDFTSRRGGGGGRVAARPRDDRVPVPGAPPRDRPQHRHPAALRLVPRARLPAGGRLGRQPGRRAGSVRGDHRRRGVGHPHRRSLRRWWTGSTPTTSPTGCAAC